MKAAPFVIALTAFLIGCGGGPARLAIPSETSTVTVRPIARSVVVGEISLPEYADASEVVRQGEDGLIETLPGVIWADIPADAMSNMLVRNLSQITGVQVSRAPWPLENLPDAELTVRVDQMLVRADNRLVLSGQFAVRRDLATWAERLRSFEIVVPVAGAELLDISNAHGAAWRQLAETIAPQL